MSGQQVRDEQVERIAENFLRLPAIYRRIFMETDTTDGLTGPKIWTLLLLRKYGPSSITELAKKIHYSKQTMTTLVQQLEDEGFLSRNVSGEDRRTYMLSITSAGEKAAEKKKAQFKAALLERLAALSDEEVDRLAQAFADIYDILVRPDTKGWE